MSMVSIWIAVAKVRQLQKHALAVLEQWWKIVCII